MTGDFHIHTRISDGSCSADRVIELAKSKGLSHISITDHDNYVLNGSYEKLASKMGVELLNGVELSSMDAKRGRRVHILCYLPKKTDEILSICESTTKNRIEAGRIMAERVAKLFPITVGDIENEAKHSNCIFKQHIMQVLLEAGYTTSLYGDLYKELFSFDGGSCVVDCVQPDVFEVAEAARNSGGVVVMAHPFTYDGIDVMHELIEANLLDGIEVWSSKSNDKMESYLREVADNNSLIKLGGSDFHGAFSSKIAPIGIKPTPNDSIEKLYNLIRSR